MNNWAIVAPKVPPAAYSGLEKIVRAYQGQIRLAPPRRSKWGDFRWKAGGPSRISINRDLAPEAFLITLLHELAHAQVQAWDARDHLPHGAEWQRRYRDLLRPFLDTMYLVLPWPPPCGGASASPRLLVGRTQNSSKPCKRTSPPPDRRSPACLWAVPFERGMAAFFAKAPSDGPALNAWKFPRAVPLQCIR